mgnify:CR=1 FL=1
MKYRSILLYAAISFVLILAITYGFGVVTTRKVTDQITKAHLRQLPETVQGIMREHPDASPWFSRPPEKSIPAPVRDMFTALTNIPGVFRAKLWDTHGTILWSDRQELIGENFAQDQHFQLAAMGETAFNNEGRLRLENMSEQGEKIVVEVYVPVRVKGKVVGVIEVYENDSGLSAQLIEVEQSIKKNIILAGGILYLLLLSLYIFIQAVFIQKPKPLATPTLQSIE